jgi:hypothetical protein
MDTLPDRGDAFDLPDRTLGLLQGAGHHRTEGTSLGGAVG